MSPSSDHFSCSIALDDFWSIQLDKMDSFTCLRPLDVDIDPAAGSDSSDEDDDGDDSGDDDEQEGGPDDASEGVDEEEDAQAAPVVEPTQVYRFS